MMDITGMFQDEQFMVRILLRLCPDIQKAILAIREMPNPPAIGEHILRPIACLGSPRRQMVAFETRMKTEQPTEP